MLSRRGGGTRALAIVLGCLALLGAGNADGAPAAERAEPATASSALGIACVRTDGVRFCPGALANRVPSWDGTPLDADVYLPPKGTPGPYPLIVGLHGFGVNKLAAFERPNEPFDYARQGYAVLAYSARGLGLSCGVPASRTPGCEKGYIRLADARYEGRDTQYLAGKLVDEGLVKPKRIGVTGSSYGGGQSFLLATLRNRMMLPDGKLVPFTSPKGVPMKIAAAAPKIGWSDLAYALAPSGRTLDFRATNPYGSGIGIVKYSYLQGLFAAGLPGYYAPPGTDPEADIINWKAELDGGEPYDEQLIDHIRTQLQRYHSAYWLQRGLPAPKRIAPAPTIAYNAWVDDIMPPSEALRFYNSVHAEFPKAEVGLVFDEQFGHNRGSLAGDPVTFKAQVDKLFDRYLMGNRKTHTLKGVITQTQACGDSPKLGPFRTRDWDSQHPGEVRVHRSGERTFGSAGGSALLSAETDPFAGGGACRTFPVQRDGGAATYTSEAASGDGWTLIGSPTVTGRFTIDGDYPEIVARLWDVAPDGTQSFIQHSIYKPKPGTDRRQTFQLYPSGWHFAPGHKAKLELLGRDFPYAQPTNGDFTVSVHNLHLKLPVRERPDGAQISRYKQPYPLELDPGKRGPRG